MPHQHPYEPIECAIYSAYELAISRHQLLKLRWRDTYNRWRNAVLQPIDLRTVSGLFGSEEYLIAYDWQDREIWIRLDQIQGHELMPAAALLSASAMIASREAVAL